MLRKSFVLLSVLVFLSVTPALPFGEAGCGAGECKDCHSLSKEQAMEALGSLGIDSVANVELSEVPGLWSIDVVNRGKKIPVYLDFSLRYLIQGEVVEIATRESITKMRMASLNKVDAAAIPLEDSLVIGDPGAPIKLFLFDDPVCPYCKKIQPELEKVVELRPDIAIYIKMFPLDMHPDAFDKARAILCENSLELLHKSLDGEELPPPSCESDAVARTKELAKKLGIRSTPTLVYPDGRVIPGYRKAEKIIEGLGEEKSAEQ